MNKHSSQSQEFPSCHTSPKNAEIGLVWHRDPSEQPLEKNGESNGLSVIRSKQTGAQSAPATVVRTATPSGVVGLLNRQTDSPADCP